jgi:hypothetical protein
MMKMTNTRILRAEIVTLRDFPRLQVGNIDCIQYCKLSCANRIIVEIPTVRNVWQRCLPLLPAAVNSDVLTELLPVASWHPWLPFLAPLLEILAC